jgi:serine/threonine-protein kinase
VTLDVVDHPASSERPQTFTSSIGMCEVVAQLARGGMAELLLARVVEDEGDGGDQLVVLKRILPQFATNPRVVKLFLEEARLVAMLDHPHIVQMFDVGHVDGDFVLVMEYVHGKDVRSMIRRTAQRRQELPIGAAVEVARNIAGALHYAHERRAADDTPLEIIHRDVSPSNIVVAYDGAVKLVDFGIAKTASSSVETRTGVLEGKVQYMSPEQARGAAVDRRSDVFSLGIVLWEMITMRRLFQADNDLAAIQRILHANVPRPSTLRPECPPELDRITAKALASEADARYQTADELARDLAELPAPQGASTRTLRMHMQQLFEPEIAAWRDAQEAGLTLVDHVTVAGPDLWTSASDSEIELVDDVEDATVHCTPRPSTGVIRHPSVAPVIAGVTTYPSIRSDPSYVTISQGRRPEPSPSARVRTLIWVLVLATVSGIALAMVVSCV